MAAAVALPNVAAAAAPFPVGGIRGPASAMVATPRLGWTDDENKMLRELIAMNGVDAYSTESSGLGGIPPEQYLYLPNDFKAQDTDAALVGISGGGIALTVSEIASIYALNKAVCPTPADAVKFAATRVNAVIQGWVKGQKEIKYVATPADADAVFKADQKALANVWADSIVVAKIQPLMGEFVFRTTGHHFLTGQLEEYRAKYTKLYTSSLKPQLANFMEPNMLYHACLHWVSPARAYSVLIAQVGTGHIPDALTVRAKAAPAGTALLTTVSAVMNLAPIPEIAAMCEKYLKASPAVVKSMADTIQANPVIFHKTPTAYGRAPMDRATAEKVEFALKQAEELVPVVLAIVDVFGRDTDLANAKAYKKFDLKNPLITKRLRNYLRTQTGKESLQLEEVFSMSGKGAEI